MPDCHFGIAIAQELFIFRCKQADVLNSENALPQLILQIPGGSTEVTDTFVDNSSSGGQRGHRKVTLQRSIQSVYYLWLSSTW